MLLFLLGKKGFSSNDILGCKNYNTLVNLARCFIVYLSSELKLENIPTKKLLHQF